MLKIILEWFIKQNMFYLLLNFLESVDKRLWINRDDSGLMMAQLSGCFFSDLQFEYFLLKRVFKNPILFLKILY